MNMFCLADAVFVYEALKLQGGYTYKPDTETPSYGYMVGGAAKPLTAPQSDVTAEVILAYANVMQEALSAPEAFLGVWLDPETGLVWLDVSDWHFFSGEAARISRERGEISYWDLHKEKAIPAGQFDPCYLD